jgi:ribonuclease III
MPNFSELEQRLGHSFTTPDFLVEALTHRSYLNEHREYAGSHNERLEFLGDAVLELAVTDFLLRNIPPSPRASSPPIAPHS